MSLSYQKRLSHWRPFEEAREFTHRLGLKSQSGWRLWAMSSDRPGDIPANPPSVYKDKGWSSWGDWLGTGRIADQYKIFRSFEKARAFAQAQGLKNKDEWTSWAKTKAKPNDIPANPRDVYKKQGWVGWGDWLGTGFIANQNRIYRPFEEAHTFARSLQLKGQIDWVTWAKSSERPDDIPADPANIYKNNGWTNWADWLGTRRRRGGHCSFEAARKFVHTLGLKNRSDWVTFTQTSKCPNNIPANPSEVYRNLGWTGWGDWLGTHNRRGRYRQFRDARAIVRNLELKNQKDWRRWSKTDLRPEDIPNCPEAVYKGKGWVSWSDWLGTRNKKGGYRSFQEARVFVHTLKLRDVAGWVTWAKSAERPPDIPADPKRVYKDNGWTTWGDWLGTGRIATFNVVYRPFQEARVFTRDLKLANQFAWRKWAQSDARPSDIPASPDRTYKNKGWISWGDWLGVINLWNRNAILNFLYGIKPVLRDLEPAELYAIMRQNGLIASLRHITRSSALIRDLRDLCSSPNTEADFEKLVSEIEKQNEEIENKGIESEEETTQVIPSEEETKIELPALRSLAALKAVDALVEAGITSDEETIEFLVANRVSGLWQAVLNNDPAVELNALRNETGGSYFNTIRSRFLTQYDGAQAFALPAGYDFRVKGKFTEPNLMQRLAAYRVLSERRLGNWSGVGAGKTLSAILASRAVDAHLTIVVAFNSTVEPWATRIKEAFPDSVVHIKERGTVRVDSAKHTYSVLNFETFQQPDSAAMVRRLVEQHQIDFVVLDEIQSVKQRTPKVASRRRQVVAGLLSAASEKNPNLCVLGMSATPVINNLYEAKALLELVKGVEFDDLKTFSSIANASAMHEKLILYGIRYRPRYSQTIETDFKEIPGNDYLPRLLKVKKGAILELERVLLDAKLETIIASLKTGTLVYTHYLTGLVAPLRRAIEKAGFKVGYFTGEDKSGLEPFINGKIDVLIGSVPVGTGVDGLQYVCNRMIAVSLPWTSAEYEQLVGRLYRQGSAFDKVEVVIPQVVLENDGNVWSWDKMRMHRIQYKKTLADAALDGVIPEGELASPETMFKNAREALQAWIARVEQDGLTTIDRAKLRVPLPEEQARVIQRRFGDLSAMNSRINTAYSQTTHERLQQNPEEWYLYHTLYRAARQMWSEIPYEKIAESLKKRPDWVIGDFGCGEALLAQILPNKVHSFDHIAINENVTACDMAHTPLDAETLDVAVFSLSLMGLNYADYLKEAYRTLKYGGYLRIAEPISRWSEKRSELLSRIGEAGFLLFGNVEESNQFFYINAIKAIG